MAKARKRSAGARGAANAAALERVKFFGRVAPADVELFRAVRSALIQAEGRRVTDAEVFRLALRALVASLPAEVRARVARSAG